MIRENARPGTTSWLLTAPRIEPATRFRCPWIEGWCSHATARAGDTVSFHVSARPASRFTLDIYRLGWYGGAGARHVLRLGPFEGAPQPEPPLGPRRLRECRWEPCARLRIPDDWVSGVYLGRLVAECEGVDSYLVFVLRDERPAEVVFQCSDLTWQAYNRWPDKGSVYDDGERFWTWGPGVDVSFDRPYGRYCQLVDAPLSTGSGEFLLWEMPVAFWLESQGVDVTYVSNLDVHRQPETLLRARGFLSVGHDEYWTLEMFEGVRRAVESGVSVAFLSANTCCGRVALRASGDGRRDRILTRVDRFGGVDPRELAWFPELAGFPGTTPRESLLIGARTQVPATGSADWICTAPEHWIFEGTGMRAGDAIPGLVGWEYHGGPEEIPGLEVVASGETRSHHGAGRYHATVYPGPRGNFVFNAATCWWGDGLSEPPGYVRPRAALAPLGPDARVQRITANLLARMRAQPAPLAGPPLAGPPRPATPRSAPPQPEPHGAPPRPGTAARPPGGPDARGSRRA